MGRDPSEVRAEIEETRARVGEDVDALSYKTDVKARTADYVGEKKDAVVSKVKGAGDSITSTVSGATPDGEQMKAGAGRMKNLAESNPLGLAIGSAALGFVLGTLLPSSKVEDEQIGEFSDRVGDTVRDAGHEAVERAKHVAQEAGQAASETAREEGSELASSVQEDLRSQ
jgi:hypothetical protein